MEKLCPFRAVVEYKERVHYVTGTEKIDYTQTYPERVFQPCLGEKCAMAVVVRGGPVNELEFDVEFECGFAVAAKGMQEAFTPRMVFSGDSMQKLASEVARRMAERITKE